MDYVEKVTWDAWTPDALRDAALRAFAVRVFVQILRRRPIDTGRLLTRRMMPGRRGSRS